MRAIAYPDMVGDIHEGCEVLLNTSALERGLGTGGYAFVIAIIDEAAASLPAPPESNGGLGAGAGPGGGSGVRARNLGHLVKARYTPLQAMVQSVDEQDSIHHAALHDADSIGGMPVVVADLHSSLPAVIAGARASFMKKTGRWPTIAYVMTDGGALPVWFSRNVAALREDGWIDATITCGQAFGGDLETVTVHTALLAAHLVVAADLAVVIQGPGNLGTDTRWGFSGVAVGEVVNAAGTLGGRPVAVLRMSQADARDRHLGLSHHTVTALGRVALRPADLVLPPPPAPCPPWWEKNVAARLAPLVAPGGLHRLVAFDAEIDARALAATSCVPLSTMGRTLDQDEIAFTAAVAAGYHAGMLAGN
ncbi:DUF3866 family protein [Rarobacter incanus]